MTSLYIHDYFGFILVDYQTDLYKKEHLVTGDLSQSTLVCDVVFLSLLPVGSSCGPFNNCFHNCRCHATRTLDVISLRDFS